MSRVRIPLRFGYSASTRASAFGSMSLLDTAPSIAMRCGCLLEHKLGEKCTAIADLAQAVSVGIRILVFVWLHADNK